MRDRLFDFQRTYFQREQPDPPRLRLRKAFSTQGIVRARAYAYRMTEQLDCSTTTLPIDKNGKLCDGVVAPGVELTSQELARAIEVVGAAQERIRKAREAAREARGTDRSYRVTKIYKRCEFDPHHTLLFYDSSGAVVGGVLVCFTCGDWQLVPSVPDIDGDMTDDEERALRELFDAHELGAVFWDDQQQEELNDYVRRVYGSAPSALTEAGKQRQTQRLARGSGIDPNQPARDLSRDERLRSCVWFRHELRRGRSYAHPGSGYECDNGRKFSLPEETTLDCAAKKIDCDASAGQLEACLAALIPDVTVLCADELPAACGGVIGCLPEIAWPKEQQ